MGVDVGAVARHLNGAASNGQLRAACNAALRALDDARALAQRLPGGSSSNLPPVANWLFGSSGDVGVTYASASKSLETARAAVQSALSRLEGADNAKAEDFARARAVRAVTGAYQEIYGLEGALGPHEQFRWVDTLAVSIKEAPGVFIDALGTVLRKTGESAGQLVGEAGKGLSSGVGSALGGLWPILLLVGIGGFLYFRVIGRRFT